MVVRALVYGRFQPFHKGHVSLAKWAFSELNVDEIVFLIGMASESYTPRNPFTAGERIEMIRLSFLDEGLPLSRLVTATIETLEVNIGLTYYVLSYVPRISYIIARNPIVLRIFKDVGLRVAVPPYFNRSEWRGSRIRELIARGDPRWKDSVTPSTARFIEEIRGTDRIREIYSTSESSIRGFLEF